ncbi:mycothiol transferase [Citricoccus muralis]|uniref:DUF664 domain-containing protein n=1 Tax=Citricoccus muralis TaxID=169134 RepID=A0ABY8H3C4_9MICC|nr:DinB family protein [Citricoccus muralis]WFP15570.1 DUF664 domain-containing protein [Citricoccus muralis]
MDAITVLSDLAARPLQAMDYFWDELEPARINDHPGGHPNSIAWLLWHSARETDAQIAPLSDTSEVWTAQGFAQRFDFDGQDLGALDMGYGQNPAAAEAITVPATQEGKSLLREYLEAVYQHLGKWIQTLDASELDRVVDHHYDPPATLGVRVISVIDDAVQHVGQAAYIAGMPLRPSH